MPFSPMTKECLEVMEAAAKSLAYIFMAKRKKLVIQ